MKASILLALAICIILTLEFEFANGYALGPCDEDWADICEDASKWFFSYQRYDAVNNTNVISDHKECGCSNNQCTSCTQMRKTNEGPCTTKAEKLCRKASK